MTNVIGTLLAAGAGELQIDRLPDDGGVIMRLLHHDLHEERMHSMHLLH